MAGVKRFANWSSVSGTPSGGSATPITRVKSCKLDRNIKMITGMADADFYPSHKRAITADPRFTIVTEDESAAMVFYEGVKLTALTATHNDAENVTGVASGALTYAFTGARVCGADAEGEHANYGQLTLQFEFQSTDGLVSPITLSVA